MMVLKKKMIVMKMNSNPIFMKNQILMSLKILVGAYTAVAPNMMIGVF